ncbi:MAG: hypothetical protein H0U27_13595 [Nitrosopumilus sp.]|nr:hypothetical protein [Nitrosopumilus sp.]
MKNLLIIFTVFMLVGCASTQTQEAANSINYADLKGAFNPCFIVDKKLSNHSIIVTTPDFMDNSYGFFVENHFKKDRTINLKVGEMIEEDIHDLSNEVFDNKCFISSLGELAGRGNLIITVDLVSSSITDPKDFNDRIATQIGVLYTFHDVNGKELFKVNVFEKGDQKASSTAAYRKVANKTVDKVISSSKVLIAQSLRNIH